MIVISDMMGTLTTGSPFLGLVDWVKHNQSKARANFYIARVMPSYYLAKNGLIDWQSWGQKLMVDSLAYIKDADEQKVKEASEWVVEYNLWKKRREDVVARLIKHHEDGAQVYIASSAVEPFIKPFAERIGAQASSRSGSVMPRRAAAFARLTRKSVPIWCPSPREPQWMDTTIWPSEMP